MQFARRCEPETTGLPAQLDSCDFSKALAGQTALLDAIYLAVNEMKQAANPKRALLIVSDGGENSSRYTRREMKRLIREADVQIYTTGIFELGAAGELAETRSRFPAPHVPATSSPSADKRPPPSTVGTPALTGLRAVHTVRLGPARIPVSTRAGRLFVLPAHLVAHLVAHHRLRLGVGNDQVVVDAEDAAHLIGA